MEITTNGFIKVNQRLNMESQGKCYELNTQLANLSLDGKTTNGSENVF